MPRMSELVEATAKATRLPHRLVGLYARRLIDNGILPKGRGSVGGWAEPQHAAALLVALWATDRPTDGPAKVRSYFGPALDRLTVLIKSALTMSLESEFEIHFDREPNEGISIHWYHGPAVFSRDGELETEFFHPNTRESADAIASTRIIRAVMDGFIIRLIGVLFGEAGHADNIARDRLSPDTSERTSEAS